MSFRHWKQTGLATLTPLAGTMTAIDFSGSNQTSDVDNRPDAAVPVPSNAEYAIIYIHGTHASAVDDKSISYALYGYREDGPCERICSGEAILGVNHVKGSASVLEAWAQTIGVTVDDWLETPVEYDTADDGVAKVKVKLFGIKYLYAVLTNGITGTTATTYGAKVAFV